jgi:type IV fimbrial biogenesis protein FimT
MCEFKTKRSHGFTLLELVVVVAILAIVGVVIIPSLRTLNEDRKVRDTARVVGSVFAAARTRAAVDGQAGVEITSIPNASGSYNLPNMGLVLYQLRSIPAYGGDVLGASCQYNGTGSLTFLDADLEAAGVRPNDFIEVNNSGVRLPITAVNNATQADVANTLPNPPVPTGVNLPFKIYRQPVRIESSAVRLPNNLFINLCYSGYSVAGAEMNLINPAVVDPLNPAYNVPAVVWFGSDGSITRVFDRNSVSMVTANSPVNLLMCSANRESADLTNLESTDFIRDDNSMWITIDNRTGGVTMGKMAQIADLTAPVSEQIRQSRLLARDRRSATP